LQFTAPKGVAKNPIWIPLGKGRLTGARILKREGDWAHVLPWGGPMTINNPLP
jgi:hypothetical protein